MRTFVCKLIAGMIQLRTAITAHPFIQQLYIQAFPETERRAWSTELDLLSTGSIKLLEILNNQQLVGFVFYWPLPSFYFIEHFAIDPATRGGGIGSIIMKELEQTLQSIVLEVEPPLTEDAIRRIKFYERLGYQTFPDIYHQPSYIAGEPPVELRVMYKGLPVGLTFETIRKELYSFVYQP